MNRTDPRPARGEDSYTFLNRVSGAYWERVRDFLERLFAQYPSEHAPDLKARFVDRRWDQHVGAWWELYLFGLLRSFNAELDVHPAVPEGSARPDFRVRLHGYEFFVEARYVKAGLTSGPQQGSDEWITGPLDELSHPRFMVSVRITQRGGSQPRRRDVTAGVLEWLNSIDSDEVTLRDIRELPVHRGVAGGWRFELAALPMGETSGDRRLVGVYPSTAGWDNSRDAFGRALREKAGKYGRLQAPYVIGLLSTSGFLDERDVAAALYVGPRPGGGSAFWRPPPGSRHTRVSAVMTADALMPWTVARTVPRLWANPTPVHPLAWQPGLPSASVDARGQWVLTDGTASPAELFELPPGWPGPERRFAS